MKLKKPVIFLTVVLLLAISGTLVAIVLTRPAEEKDLTRPAGEKVLTSIVSGFELLKPIPELAELSDIVVHGTVVGIKEETRKLPDMEIPPGESRSQVERYVLFESVQVKVTEYFKGSGPGVVTVFQTRPVDGIDTHEQMKLREGEEYVLFLYSTAGSEYWGDGYLIRGPDQGYWQVKNNNVTRPLIREVTMPIEQLRAQVSKSQ